MPRPCTATPINERYWQLSPDLRPACILFLMDTSLSTTFVLQPMITQTELDLTSFHLWKSRYCHWNFLYFSCFHFKEKFNVNYTLYMNELSFYYFTNLHWINAFFLYFNILRPPHKIAITIKIGLVYNKIQKPAFSWQSSKHHFNRMMSIIFAEKNLIVWLIKIQIFNIFMNNL